MHSMILRGTTQTGKEDSFVGGKPKLPEGVEIPACRLCGAAQKFYLQLAFPKGQAWYGRSLALFACADCASPEYLIPEMLQGPLRGADVSSEWLAAYQKSFRVLVFPTSAGKIREDDDERLVSRSIEFVPGRNENAIGHVGGQPKWMMDDETPGMCDSTIPVCFLFQLYGELEFMKRETAPPQIELDLAGNPTPSPNDFYQLFLANSIYAFCAEVKGMPLVYILTQVK